MKAPAIPEPPPAGGVDGGRRRKLMVLRMLAGLAIVRSIAWTLHSGSLRGTILLHRNTVVRCKEKGRIRVAPGGRLVVGLVETGSVLSRTDVSIIQVVGPRSELVVNGNVSLGPGVRISCSGGRLQIGEGTSLTSSVVIICHESVTLGRNCAIADGVLIRDSDGHQLGQETGQASRGARGAVVIGDHVWVGSRAVILKGVTIGNGSVVAACAVVVRDVPPNTLVGGNPARVIREGVSWT